MFLMYSQDPQPASSQIVNNPLTPPPSNELSSDLERPSNRYAIPTGSPLPRLPASPPAIRSIGQRIPPLPETQPLHLATDPGNGWSSDGAEVHPPSPPTSVPEPLDVGSPHPPPSTGDDSSDEEVSF